MRFAKCAATFPIIGLGLLLTACGKGQNQAVETASPPVLAPVITQISPSSGGFGTLVTLTGSHFANKPSDNRVVVATAAQGELSLTPLAVSADTLQFIMPSAMADAILVSVKANAKQSGSLAFTATAFSDPTPNAPASELKRFFNSLDATLGGITSATDLSLAPFLLAKGQAAQAQRLHEALQEIRQGFSQFAADQQVGPATERLNKFDAFFASDSGQKALQQLNSASEKLKAQVTLMKAKSVQSRAINIGSVDSGALEDLRDAKAILKQLRSIMEDLNNALIAAELGLGASTVVFEGAPALIVILEDIRTTVVKTIIDVLNVVIVILDSVPTEAVGGTLAITLASNDLFMNQSFGSMQAPIPEERNPGHILVREPYGVKGTIDFHNDGSKSINQTVEELVGDLNPVAGALLKLSGFKIDEIVAERVEIKLKLVADRPGIFTGSWGSDMLTISASQPGEAKVSILGDLRQMVPDNEPCPVVDLGIASGGGCIHDKDLQVTRPMKAYAGRQTSGPYSQGPLLLTAQVDGLAANQGYIGDTLHVTGEGFTQNPQLAHQDIYFGSPLPDVDGPTGLAWSIHESVNRYNSLDVEVPDALSGPMNVSLERHPSNALDFTILPPQLERPPPSAIVGEAWPNVNGRGFSHSLSRNQGDWNGGRATPFAPAAPAYSLGNEAAHRHLEFIVPESAATGPFKVITLGQLQSNSFDVAVRKFSPATSLSVLERAGLRPALARDASNGRRIVAWIDHSDDGGNQLVATVLSASATTFSTPVVVSTNMGGLAGAPPKPAVAAANGKLYVAWVGTVAGNDEIFFSSSSDGSTWSAPVNLSNSNNRSSLQPTLSADGSLVALAWIEEGVREGDNAAMNFRISNNSGTTFGAALSPGGAGDTTDPAVMVKGQAVAVAWSSFLIDKRDVFVQRSDNAGANFSTAWHAADNAAGGVARHPSLAIGPSCIKDGVNSVYLAWENASSASLEEEVRFARWDGDASMASINVSNTESYSRSPVITVDGDCIPALAWMEQGLPLGIVRKNGVTGTRQSLPSSLHFARSFDKGASFSKPYITLLEKTDGSRLGHLAMINAEQALLSVVYQEDVGTVPRIVFRSTEGEPKAPLLQPDPVTTEPNIDLVYRGYSGGIYVSKVDGSRLQRVSRDFGTTHAVALSPNGRHIAFMLGIDRLMVAEADGAYPMYVAVTADFVMNGGVYWSPRGDYIGITCAWTECPVDGPFVGWVRPDSTEFRLSGHVLGGAEPAVYGSTGAQPWSPSGRLVSVAGTAFGLVDPKMNINTPLAVAMPAGKFAYFPTWSADGSRIAFIASSDASVRWTESRHGYGDIYTMNADGSNAQKITVRPDAAMPVWSPDGSKIAYVSNRDSSNNRRVFVMDASGTLGSDIDLASNPVLFDDSMPVFLPDGSGVVIQRRDTRDNATQLIVVSLASPTVYTALTPAGYAGPGTAFHLGTRPVWASGAGVVASNIGTTGATINWPSASDNRQIAEYRIYSGGSLFAVVPGSGAGSFTATGLASETAYTFTVQACDASGNCSIVGPKVTFSTAAAGPTPTWGAQPPVLKKGYAYDAAYSAQLEWTPANESNVEYKIYRDGVLVSAAPFASASISGLRPVTNYMLRIEACFADGGNCTTNGPTLALVTEADTSSLALNSAESRAAAVTLNYNDPVDDNSVPSIGDFSVKVNGNLLSVSAVTVHADAKEVILTLAQPVFMGDVVLVSYSPGSAPIQDFGGHKAGAFVDQSAPNSAYLTSEAIAADAAGNVYVAGYIEGAAKFGTHVISAVGHGDAYIAKRNAAGVWQWAKTAGGTGWDAAYALAVDADYVYLAGAFSGQAKFGAQTLTPNGAADLFVAKLDHSGNWQWAARAGGAPPTNPYTGIPGDGFNGLPFVEVANSVAVDGAGNVYVAAKFTGTASFGSSNFSVVSSGEGDIVVAKLNGAGDWQWAARAGGSATDFANGVAVDGTGVYVTGASGPNANFGANTLLNAGLFVAKLDTNGAWKWVSDGGTLAGGGNAVVTDGVGNVYVVGNNAALSVPYPISHPFVGRWNTTGTLQWMRTATGGTGIASALTLNADGYLYTAGRAQGTLSFGSLPAAISGVFGAKINVDGAWQWALAGGGYESKGIASCSLSVVCVTGTFSSSATFGSLPPITSGSYQDLYVAKAGNTLAVPPVGEWLSVGGVTDVVP